jgi:threonine aldolase
MERIIDLRSDTATLPTEEMLEATRNAQFGDDNSREDPTVNKLEALAAEKMGKERALLTASGTMANLIAMMVLTKGGDEVIVEAKAHLYYNEGRGISSLARVYYRPIPGHQGALDPRDVENAIRPLAKRAHDQPKTSLVCIENTHNNSGGTVIRPEQIKKLHEVTQANNIKLYLDGARIFNAAVALEIDVQEFTKHVDAMMFCLSKGLSAPVGSLLVGSEEFIEKARWARQEVGGAMRQAGIIAASGIVAIEKMVDRLKDDHRNARILAEGLAEIDGISIEMESVQTSIVMFDVSGLGVNSDQFVSALNKRGIKSKTRGKTAVRMIPHRGIEEEDIHYTLQVIKDVVKELR